MPLSGILFDMLRSHLFSLVVSISAFSAVGLLAQPNLGSRPGDWPMYARDYASTGYSPLTSINANNVAGLKQICSYAVPGNFTFESSLVVISGTMYFTTADSTYALDASNCALKWRVSHEGRTPGRTNRGVAISGNRLFRGFNDGTVIAYDIRNGEQLWSAFLKEADSDRPATIAASPKVWDNTVFVGTSGAERACGCIVAALDAETGKVKWTFALAPTGDAPGAETWPKGIHVGGGSVWTTVTIDPTTGTVWVPTGNPGPDFSGAYRPGANLYTGSIVALDAKTGKLKSWYQLVPHDVHDWDQAAAPTLIKTRGGRQRAMAAGKDGFLHAIDIAAGKVAWKVPITTIENIDAPLSPEGTHFCPGDAGGVQWNGPAFYPASNLVLVGSVDWCATVKLDPKLPAFADGQRFLGSTPIDDDPFGKKDARKVGWVMAVDADSGAVKWKYQTSSPVVAAVTVTASGLVMTADLNGDFLVFDAASGKLIHKIQTGQAIGSGVTTYEASGKQRVAFANGMENPIFETHGKPSILVYGLQ